MTHERIWDEKKGPAHLCVWSSDVSSIILLLQYINITLRALLDTIYMVIFIFSILKKCLLSAFTEICFTIIKPNLLCSKCYHCIICYNSSPLNISVFHNWLNSLNGKFPSYWTDEDCLTLFAMLILAVWDK